MDALAVRDAYDVVIVGGGAAGLNAALVLARARRSVLVVDAGEPRNAPARHVHGFLSRDGMPPGLLLEAGRREVLGYGGQVATDKVVAVEPGPGAGAGFRVGLGSGRAVTARRLLVATGLVDELPPVPGLAERWGRDVLHCPYCHGWEVRDQPLGVLAAGPLSVHQALLVRQWSEDVVFFADGSPPSTGDAAALARRGVPVVGDPVDSLVVAADALAGVRLRGDAVVPRSAVFVAPRSAPRDDLLLALGARRAATPVGEFVATDHTGLTSVPGVWAAGNVADPTAQVINAAAGGARAAAAINGDLVTEESATGAV